MAFDEDGQAETVDEKVNICKRAYDLLLNEINGLRGGGPSGPPVAKCLYLLAFLPFCLCVWAIFQHLSV